MADVKNSSLATDLVSYWEFEEASGSRIDSHGSNDLTDNNTVGQATGKIGNAADLELANSESLSITDAAQTGLDITGDFSMSLWWKPESKGTSQVFIGKWAPSNYSYGVRYQASDGFSMYNSSNGSSVFGFGSKVSHAITIGNWYHVVAVFDVSAGSCKFYIDGVDIGSSTGMRTSTFNGAAPFTVGKVGTADELGDGLYDELAVWGGRLLSAGDVSDLYNSGNGIPYEATSLSQTARRGVVMMG